MAPSSKRERERRLAAKRALKQQKKTQRMAARAPGATDAEGSSGTVFDEGFGAPGTVYLTAPLIRELSRSRDYSVDALLVARSRGGFWSRQQNNVLLPQSLADTAAPDEPHSAYISELCLAEKREQLNDSRGTQSASTICRTVSCTEPDCDFRIRFESVCVVGECIADLPTLIHNGQTARCDNCLEESWHHLELQSTVLCAHCGSSTSDYAAADEECEEIAEAEEQAEE